MHINISVNGAVLEHPEAQWLQHMPHKHNVFVMSLGEDLYCHTLSPHISYLPLHCSINAKMPKEKIPVLVNW